MGRTSWRGDDDDEYFVLSMISWIGFLQYYLTEVRLHRLTCCSIQNHYLDSKRVSVMVFNAAFNNIYNYIVAVSFIGGGNRSTQRKPPICCKSLTHSVISITPCHEGFKLTSLVVIGTDCTGSCKSNFHKITTMTAPWLKDNQHLSNHIEIKHFPMLTTCISFWCIQLNVCVVEKWTMQTYYTATWSWPIRKLIKDIHPPWNQILTNQFTKTCLGLCDPIDDPDDDLLDDLDLWRFLLCSKDTDSFPSVLPSLCWFFVALRFWFISSSDELV